MIGRTTEPLHVGKKMAGFLPVDSLLITGPGGAIATRRSRPATGQDAVTSIRLSPDFRDALDKWSRLQPDKPTRSEAIRRIVERSIARKK